MAACITTRRDGCRVVQKNREALFATRRKYFTYQVDDVINQVFVIHGSFLFRLSYFYQQILPLHRYL